MLSPLFWYFITKIKKSLSNLKLFGNSAKSDLCPDFQDFGNAKVLHPVRVEGWRRNPEDTHRG
jgi:hypothetical protein